jgi:hypothetical protein
MKSLSSGRAKHLLAVFLTLLIVFETIAYFATTPLPREQFFELYVLGANRLLSDYYPNDDPNIMPSELIRWYVGATNFMGNVQLVAIRVKLANQTIQPPDDLEAQPSPAPLVTEFLRFIQDNETWEFPFFWQIVNGESLEGSTRILELQINNETYQIKGPMATNGYNFRLIFELWSWDLSLGALQFGWSAGGERRAAWVQVWFNMTSPPPREIVVPGFLSSAAYYEPQHDFDRSQLSPESHYFVAKEFPEDRLHNFQPIRHSTQLASTIFPFELKTRNLLDTTSEHGRTNQHLSLNVESKTVRP